ncbi:hypothetical protein [Caproiciproducens sp. CPB-2]|uniref:hypothetical protein n=1 Tax=Caproiciproducens sp. CPB-2 TaxID=3030017 RepID=UPI0023DB0317|nr:hypothetical protein [Caproiciproducens sp. CPB-2]MDF1496340.1 hypothetical protein [Caproiciproducens sp. CPB-2]
MALPTVQNTEPLMLGSGELFIAKSKDISNLAIPTDEDLAKFVNIGAIKENASLSIKDEMQDVKGANRGLIYKALKERNVTFKTGIITFNLENLYKFIYGGDFTDDTTKKVQTFSIGNEVAGKCYLIFVHTDKETGHKLTVKIPQALFIGEQQFAWGEDAVSTNYEFAALSTQINGKQKYVLFDNDYNDVV